MQGNERGAAWPADFDRQGEIRALRANYGNEAVMMNNAGEDCYTVFKGYYQLCGEAGREAGVRMRYGTHQTGGGESLRPGNKVIHLNPQPAPKPKKAAKNGKTKATKAGPSTNAPTPVSGNPSTTIAPSPTPNLATKPVPNLASPFTFNTIATPTGMAISPRTAVSSNASTPLPHTPKRTADEAGLSAPLTDKQRLKNLLATRPTTTPVEPQPQPAAVVSNDVPLLQALVRKLLDSSARLGVCLNKQTEAVAELRRYIAELKDRIDILKGNLGSVEDYAAGTQSTLAEVINIPGSIVEYLRENGRMADADAVKEAEDEWIVLNVEGEKTLLKHKGADNGTEAEGR